MLHHPLIKFFINKITVLTIGTFFIFFAKLNAQVGIGTTTPNASSMLDVTSSSKGLLIPRVSLTSSTDATTIANPVTSLLVFNSNAALPGGIGYYFNSGIAASPLWVQLATVAASNNNWAIMGNSGTDTAVNFIGTTDAHPLLFKVNNQKAGLLDYLNGNTGFGYHSLMINNAGGINNTASGFNTLQANTSGVDNSAIGYGALYGNTTGSANTASGYQSLYTNTTGFANTANGYLALYSNTTGTNNTSYGFEALNSNTVADYNVAFGAYALKYNTTGIQNSALGSSALASNTTGSNNTAGGYQSLLSNDNGNSNTAYGDATLHNNTIGTYNTAIGYTSLYSNLNGDYNTATGGYALYNNVTGKDNTATGLATLFRNMDGNDNTALGFKALYANTSGSSNTATGYLALNSNTTGYSNTANGYVALNTNTTGYYNTADGIASLFSNSTGIGNTATGYAALNDNSSGYYNTGTGQGALYNNTTGQGNTAFGYGADVASGNLTNAMSLGFFASVNASNKVVVGNTSVSVIGGQVGWSTFSDGRFKSNINENVPGLAFITKLKPVTYTLELRKLDHFLGKKDSVINSRQADYDFAEKKVHTGFVAQDVEKAAQTIHYDFDGVNHPQSDRDNYTIAYANLIPSLVKAIQEQQILIEKLEKEVELLKVKTGQSAAEVSK